MSERSAQSRRTDLPADEQETDDCQQRGRQAFEMKVGRGANAGQKQAKTTEYTEKAYSHLFPHLMKRPHDVDITRRMPRADSHFLKPS
jgi:hypothetical protein